MSGAPWDEEPVLVIDNGKGFKKRSRDLRCLELVGPGEELRLEDRVERCLSE